MNALICMDKKRLLILILFLAVSGVIGFFLFRFFFRAAAPPSPTEVTETPTTGPGALPTAGEGAPREAPAPPGVLPTTPAVSRAGVPSALPKLQEERQLVAEPVIAPQPDQSGRVSFYNDTDGKFYRVDGNGRVEVLSDQIFFNVERVTWSPDANESIIEYPDGANIYYNFDTRQQVTLPKHWEAFSFSPGGDRIAAKSVGFSPENRWLVTAAPDGANTTLIAPMGDNDDRVIVDWSPNNQVVGFSRTGDALGGDREEILLVGLHGENFKSLTVEGRDFQSAWNTSGNKLLYSVYSAESDFKPTLWVVNAEGDAIGSGRRLLNVETWANKCAFADERTVYCGVPQELSRGAGFAPALADQTPDTLVRIDTQTGARTEIALETPHTIDTITVAPDGETLYFTDKGQSGVFSVNL